MTKIDDAIAALKSGFSGTLILPTDAAYDTARTVMYGGNDKHPGVIARVKTAADVQRVINVARDTGVEFSVRSGGHSNAGHSTNEGGLVLDLRDMHAISVDTPKKPLTAEPGATAMDVPKAALEHGKIV